MQYVFRPTSGLEKLIVCVCLLAIAATLFFAPGLKYSPLFISPGNLSVVVREQEETRCLADLGYLEHRGKPNDASAASTASTTAEKRRRYDIFVVLVSLQRRRNGSEGTSACSSYLVSSLAAVLPQIEAMPKYATFGLAVCDVNRDPDDVLPRLRSSVNFTTFVKRDRPDTELGARFSSVTHDNERLDYLFCLDAARKFVSANSDGAEFYLVLQDDAVAEKGAFEFLWNKRDKFRKFFGVKLHFPPKWQGFSLDLRTPLELLAVFVFFGGSMTFCLQVCSQLIQRRVRSVVAFRNAFVLFGLTVVAVCFVLGRQHSILAAKHVLNLRSLTRLSDCCIPAVLYPSKTVDLIVDGMRETKCSKSSPFDVSLAEFAARVEGGGSFPNLEPNLFKHIGRISTLTDAKSDLDYYDL